MPLNDILPAVLDLTSPEKIKLIRLLAEDLDSRDDISPFRQGHVYELHTPYDSFGAAEILARAMASDEEQS